MIVEVSNLKFSLPRYKQQLHLVWAGIGNCVAILIPTVTLIVIPGLEGTEIGDNLSEGNGTRVCVLSQQLWSDSLTHHIICKVHFLFREEKIKSLE